MDQEILGSSRKCTEPFIQAFFQFYETSLLKEKNPNITLPSFRADNPEFEIYKFNPLSDNDA
jgi:hypothetical protein